MPNPAVRASSAAPAYASSWVRGVLIALAMAGFLTYFSAAGTGDMPWLWRLAYWVTVMAAGSLVSSVVGIFLERQTRLNTWQEVAFMLAIIIPLISVTVWLITAAFEQQTPQWRRLPYFVPPVAIISAVMTFLHMQVNRIPVQSHTYPEARITEPGETFRERLGFKYRHADILALSAEDHYLRVHTSAGETLILMRLYDAIRELDGIEGSQIHRSWWVAKDAVADVRRNDGRVALALKNGVAAPVSRSYAKALKGDGWL
ncbi:lytTr DNA-binding domain protein [Asticcacaulis biprosthecium C19]|uniref:LytTr DNA-binding domain protein n=1 Tax=Asticcacaulis biprosthecium C19 TaxID=715226 RepID=F4QKE3_9CAUL|nr:LytTR family DNA-binding domain-containing protein [Asticcacaulis biprosthecium]EGF92095.1 lytTr DNA-binding domain protein [Asticcacaulis biprosthecium C19]